MAGTRTQPVNTTPKYYAADVQQDTTTFLANDAAILSALFGGWNVLLSGCALSAGAGMVVNVAAGQAVVNGVIVAVPAGTVTLAAAGAQPRYDLVYALLGTTAGTNASGQPNVTDSAALGVQTGTAAAAPTKGTLPSANYAQLGSVYVPAGAANAAACTLNSGDTAPNAQGYRSLVDLLTHLLQDVRTSAPHGLQATSAGGTETARLAQTDATYGRVGRALSADQLADTAGTYRQFAVPGSNAAGQGATYNGSGRVQDSERVGGLLIDSGQTGAQSVPNQGTATYAIAFAKAFAAAPRLDPWIVSGTGGAIPQQYGAEILDVTVTQTGATVEVGQTTGAAQSLAVGWLAVGP